jgi:hypothetical protein
MVGRLGNDAYGDVILAALAASGVDAAFVGRSGMGTGVAQIFVDARGANVIGVAPGANGALSAEEVVAALEALTRRKEESYEAFIRRVGTNPLAARVKLADLEDNMDLTRFDSPTEDDRRRVEKYAAAQQVLLSLGHEF